MGGVIVNSFVFLLFFLLISRWQASRNSKDVVRAAVCHVQRVLGHRQLHSADPCSEPQSTFRREMNNSSRQCHRLMIQFVNRFIIVVGQVHSKRVAGTHGRHVRCTSRPPGVEMMQLRVVLKKRSSMTAQLVKSRPADAIISPTATMLTMETNLWLYPPLFISLLILRIFLFTSLSYSCLILF